MQRRLVKYLNASLLALCLLFSLSAAFLWLCRPNEIPEAEPRVIQSALPKSAFSLPAEAYSNIGEPILSLQYHPPTFRLPDLKNILVYYGKNGRPDAISAQSLLHLSLFGGKESRSIAPGEKLYLVYNRKREGAGPKYTFSPQNEETSLWLEINPLHQEAQITVHMLDAKGKEVMEPEQVRTFSLPEKEFSRNMTQNWEIGKWRVDATLLARQRARWFGPDRFLEEHGGEEYQEAIGRQRIDFGEGDELYSVFVKLNDCLIYDKDRWRLVGPNDHDTLKHPLLVVKKIDERLMQLDLWDVQGKGKIGLNLLKSSENFVQQNFDQIFKFLGARTRSQFVFEIDNERVLLRPKDWLLLTDEGWKKLSTVQEIDDYVSRKLVGTLFVFDEVFRKEDKQALRGTVYNQNRTESYPVELAMQLIQLPQEKDKNKILPGAAQPKGLEAVGKAAHKTRPPQIEPPSYSNDDDIE